jgi:hypothetical protein
LIFLAATFFILVPALIFDDWALDGKAQHTVDTVFGTIGVGDKPAPRPEDIHPRCGELQERFGQPGGRALPIQPTPIVVCKGDDTQYVKVKYRHDIHLEFAEVNQPLIGLQARGVRSFLTPVRVSATSFNVHIDEAMYEEMGVYHITFYMHSKE